MKTEPGVVMVYHEHRWRAFVTAFLLSLFLGIASVRIPVVGVFCGLLALFLTFLAFVFLLRTTVLFLDPARGQVLLMVNRPFRKLRQVCPLSDVSVVLQKQAGSVIQILWFRSGDKVRHLLLAGDERYVLPRAEDLSRRLGLRLTIEPEPPAER